MSSNQLPANVVEMDRTLEGRTEKASEALAKLRWHWTLDEGNSERVSQATYAKAVGRGRSVIAHYANGYKLFLERSVSPANALSITDAVRLASQSVEQREMTEAIAEGLKQPVANVARGDNRQRRDIIAHAQDRATRRGTNPVDEARDIAEHQRKSRETQQKVRHQKNQQRSLRYVEIEGDLATAQRRLLHALSVADDVAFNESEKEVLRDAVAKVQAILKLIDLRLSGDNTYDWDAELARLSEGGGT